MTVFFPIPIGTYVKNKNLQLSKAPEEFLDLPETQENNLKLAQIGLDCGTQENKEALN